MDCLEVTVMTCIEIYGRTLFDSNGRLMQLVFQKWDFPNGTLLTPNRIDGISASQYCKGIVYMCKWAHVLKYTIASVVQCYYQIIGAFRFYSLHENITICS